MVRKSAQRTSQTLFCGIVPVWGNKRASPDQATCFGLAIQKTSQFERALGVVFGKNVYNWVSPRYSGVARQPTFQETCNFEQTPNTTWRKLKRDGRRNYTAFPSCFLRSEGAMRPRSFAPLVAQSRKSCAISFRSSCSHQKLVLSTFQLTKSGDLTH
jgi:hypothetical protein